MDCPRCGLANPRSAIRCDCGFDLTAAPAVKAHAWAGQIRAAWIQIAVGVVLASGGVTVSSVGLIVAELRGLSRYTIYFGAVIAGIAIAARGIVRLLDAKRAERASRDDAT